MADKPLQLVSGVPTEVEATVASAGAGNAGDLVALDAAGLLDVSVMPAGVGQNVDTFPTSETLAAGAFVNIWNDGGTMKVRNADATVNAFEAHGFVKALFTHPTTATVYGPGELNDAKTGLTLGAVYFLGTTAGAIQTTAPSATGEIVQRLGTAKSATAIRFLDSTVIKRA